MERAALFALIILAMVPYFSLYPAYLFKKGRLSRNSLIVYLTFTLAIISMALGTVFDSFALVILSLLALILTGVLSYLSRKKLEEDAYSVEVNPGEPLKLAWFFRLDSHLWVWLAYRIGSTRAAFLDVLITYVAVIGVIALLNHLSNGHFPLKSFSVVYAIVMALQFRKVYQNLYERTKKD